MQGVGPPRPGGSGGRDSQHSFKPAQQTVIAGLYITIYIVYIYIYIYIYTMNTLLGDLMLMIIIIINLIIIYI